MKGIHTRLLSLALAVCFAAAVTAPVSAEAFRAAAVQPAGSVMDALMEVPILGDLLRFFAGDDEEDTSETATAENAATEEQATAEQATAEQATPEDADRTVTLSGDSWPESWMIGAVSPKGRYPAGNPDAARSLTVNSPLWATVDADGATVQVSSREETNFGSLLADAMSYAAASSLVWQENTDLYSLPLVSLVNGGRLLKTVPAGTTLDENNIAEYLQDSSLSLVVVTGDKLNDILNVALKGMFSAQDENYGAFFQVSGLRFTYQTTDGDFQVKQAWLAGLSGETEIDLHGTSTRLALVLPSDLLTAYGLDSEAGYTDYLAQPEGGAAPLNEAGEDAAVQTVEAPTLHTALLDLPRNCDADTLALLLARQGAAGRILPVTADTYTVTLKTDGAVTNCTVIVYVDGEQKQGRIDGQGVLTVEGLTPGSHTIQLVQGGTAWYVSSITGFGAQGGMAVSIGAPPEGTVTGPLPTETPTPTPTPTPQMQSATAVGTPEPEGEAAPTPTPTPAPAAPAATPTPAPARTPAPVDDPTAGTIIGVTPAPTMTPTPTPSPTPEPTLSPEQQQQAEEVQELSSNLPLYVGIGVLAAGAAVVAVVMIRRRMEEKPAKRRTTYHGKKK